MLPNLLIALKSKFSINDPCISSRYNSGMCLAENTFIEVSLISIIFSFVAFLVLNCFNAEPFANSVSSDYMGSKSIVVILDLAMTKRLTYLSRWVFKFNIFDLNALKCAHCYKF